MKVRKRVLSKNNIMEFCKYGYEETGRCCCNCAHQLELFKHPMNRGVFNGRIMDSTKLYCCTIFSKIDNSSKGIIYDNKHGMCEEHCFKSELTNS